LRYIETRGKISSELLRIFRDLSLISNLGDRPLVKCEVIWVCITGIREKLII
jgi:hypothetical protein